MAFNKKEHLDFNDITVEITTTVSDNIMSRDCCIRMI